jgi:predicted O-linked N-acetylglucosamine transferase (SPINDLY family)
MTALPPSFEQRFAAALQLADAGRLAEASERFAALLGECPDSPPLRHALVRARLLDGAPDAALAAALHPSLLGATDAFRAVVADFGAAGAIEQRLALLRARLQAHPRSPGAALTLATELHRLFRVGEALHWSEHVLALRPHDPLAQAVRATALVDRGDVEAGLAAHRALLPHGDAETWARHLVLMHYDPAQTNAALHALLAEHARRHLPRFGPPFTRRAHDPERVLRVGWLTPRAGDGPVATFLGGLLAQFDRSRHAHLLVTLQPTPNSALAALADASVDASGLDDVRLLQRLRELELDVLVDLAGHATWNRIGVLAQRVAPLQVCWLDWFDTTSVPAIDAWLSDPWLTPADSSQRYSEQLVRLPSGRFCYTPPADAPAPTHDGDGAVVFASFNRLAKLNDGVLDAWAEILQRVPEATLELRARHLGEAATAAHVAARFAARGIGAERVRLGGALPYAELLAAYRRVDIALDPFPFSGCTTTCDALWMGCATITLPGETFVSRQSASLLWRLGREEWIARDRAEYVERAVAAATDVAALRAQRGALREAVRERLCDAATQAAEFAAALRELWRTRCSGA